MLFYLYVFFYYSLKNSLYSQNTLIRVNFDKLEFNNLITHIFLEIITVFKVKIIRETIFINIHCIF